MSCFSLVLIAYFACADGLDSYCWLVVSREWGHKVPYVVLERVDCGIYGTFFPHSLRTAPPSKIARPAGERGKALTSVAGAEHRPTAAA